ncbi:hypothetical protein [Edaphobacillus lindanitolerans]|uniref:Uncharacterized protein n=1 Tax=Edaphobacillus lindanitolerans TaxID=550447 RepID=A0A1U7PSU9_9BACI|nr:hypothetical protein [Edaphobacillus lindanitolerans]SIT91679.1 hypothetical protein SAMN05428946_2722 [Edaphobacillus lindanitolerans]
MAEYKVIVDFTDFQDGGHVYRADDPYPRKGAKVSEERVAELSSTENKRNEVLIVAVDDEPPESVTAEYPKHNGGGWYELSNGETVQGKTAAAKAEAELQK